MIYTNLSDIETLTHAMVFIDEVVEVDGGGGGLGVGAGCGHMWRLYGEGVGSAVIVMLLIVKLLSMIPSFVMFS